MSMSIPLYMYVSCVFYSMYMYIHVGVQETTLHETASESAFTSPVCIKPTMLLYCTYMYVHNGFKKYMTALRNVLFTEGTRARERRRGDKSTQFRGGY